jgi:hypothetical protein
LAEDLAGGAEVKIRWLDRDTVHGPYMALCLTEEAFLAAARHCKVSVAPGEWLDLSRNVAVLHTWQRGSKLMCVVCLHPDSQTADPIEVACALVHESVHVFQRLCDSIGESEPSREFEAYSIERIAERLMREFVRQTKLKEVAP